MSQVHSNTPVELHEIAAIFSLHTRRCISETILHTHFVSSYFVVWFQCFWTVHVSCRQNETCHEGGNQVKSNSPWIMTYLNEAVRGYSLKCWILRVHWFVYKITGIVGAYTSSKWLWKLNRTEHKVQLIKCWNSCMYKLSAFFQYLSIYCHWRNDWLQGFRTWYSGNIFKAKFPKHHNRLGVVCYENSQDVEYGAPTLRGEAGILTYVACVSS